MKDEISIFIGLMIGILIGFIITVLSTRLAANRAMGFGLECADKVLNNPEVCIDTTYTIHKQDTTVTYHFVKDR